MAGHADREIVGTTTGAVYELEPELRATLYEAMLDLPENARSHSRMERAIARRRRRRSRMRIAAAGLVAVASVVGVIVAVGTRSDDAPVARSSALVSTQEHSRPAETVADDQPPTTATETPAPVTSETTPPGPTPPGRDGSRGRTPRRARPALRGSAPTAAAVRGIATEHPASTGTHTPPTTARPPTTTTTAPPSTSSTTSPSTSTTTTTTTMSPPVEPPPEPPPVP